MIEININRESPCAKAFHCMVPSTRYAKNAQWAKGKELWVSNDRVFVKVKIAMPSLNEEIDKYCKAYDMKKTYFMECITGTLYFEDGRCMSSGKMPKRKFVRDDKLGSKLLSEKVAQ